jgi:hypothetical protein
VTDSSSELGNHGSNATFFKCRKESTANQNIYIHQNCPSGVKRKLKHTQVREKMEDFVFETYGLEDWQKGSFQMGRK